MNLELISKEYVDTKKDIKENLQIENTLNSSYLM